MRPQKPRQREVLRAKCGKPVASACPSCGAELRAEAKFCDKCGAETSAISRVHTSEHVAGKIPKAKPSLKGECKQVTVLFVGIEGSMDLAQRGVPKSGTGSWIVSSRFSRREYTASRVASAKKRLVCSSRTEHLPATYAPDTFCLCGAKRYSRCVSMPHA